MSSTRRNGSHRSATIPKPAAKRLGTPMPVNKAIDSKPAVTSREIPPSPGAQSPSKPMMNEVSRQAIAEAAYFLWVQRGGNALTNWLDAEAMLNAAVTEKLKRSSQSRAQSPAGESEHRRYRSSPRIQAP